MTSADRDESSRTAQPRISVTEYAVLGLLAEGPSHGFALARSLESGSEIGRVLTVRRPLVYRALDRLVELGLAERGGVESGGGPKRVIHRVTRVGHRRLGDWLGEPVQHLRDLRIEFLLKLSLIGRRGESPIELIRAQIRALRPTIEALDDPANDDRDHVELWRRNNAIAAATYLEDLETLHRAL